MKNIKAVNPNFLSSALFIVFAIAKILSRPRRQESKGFHAVNSESMSNHFPTLEKIIKDNNIDRSGIFICMKYGKCRINNLMISLNGIGFCHELKLLIFSSMSGHTQIKLQWWKLFQLPGMCITLFCFQRQNTVQESNTKWNYWATGSHKDAG